MRIEADLVYYGHFSVADINKMKVIERRFHVNEINRRLEDMAKQRKELAAKNNAKKSSRKKSRKRR